MADLVMLAEVNHATLFLEEGPEQDVPIKCLDAVFNYPKDESESTSRLRKRVKEETAIIFPTKRKLPIIRGDRIVIEGQYNLEHNDYKTRRVHLLDRGYNGKEAIFASFNFNTDSGYIQATENDFNRIGVTSKGMTL